MKRIIKFLFTGDFHLHKWKIIKELEHKIKKDGTTIGFQYHMQCEVCGEVIAKDFY